MARQARGDVPAGTYHVTLRSAGPVPMFVDDVDRHDFCARVGRTISRFSWVCRAFCLMTTHYHLLLDVGANTVQRGMHQLNGPYAQAFNKRHGRSGHLRGDRYRIEPVESDIHMLRAYRYIVRNPVRAGLCNSPADWKWSNYRGSTGLERGFAFVADSAMQEYFGVQTEELIRNLRAFCEDQ
jgi:REP-associated tyrosine transposase